MTQRLYDQIGGAPAVEELGVPADLVHEVVTVAASARDDVLNR